MSKIYSPKIVTDSLVMCLDASNNKSYPTDLPVKNGLLVWLDAADDSTFSYSSGTEVSQWRDKSGNNFHANQSLSSAQPSRTSFNNGRKSLNFIAANAEYFLISANSNLAIPGDASIFIVYKPTTQTNAYAVLLDNYHGQGGNYGFVIQRLATNSQFYYGNGNGSVFTDTSASPWTYTDNVIQLLSLNKSGATATPYISGTAQTGRTVHANTAQYTTGLVIGTWGLGGRNYNGDMCEILIFNRALSSTEMKQVHTYLGQKWGISNTDRSFIDLANTSNYFYAGTNLPRFDYYNKGSFVASSTSNSYFQSQNLNVDFNQNWTVSIWFKHKNPDWDFLMDYAQGGGGTLLTVYSDRLRWNYGAWFTDSVTDSPTERTYLVQDTIYNAVFQKSGTTLKTFLNGSSYGSTVTNSQTLTANSTLRFGVGPSIGTDSFTGNIYACNVYNRALSAAEVLQNYEAQKSKFANTIVQSGLVLNLDAGNPYSYAGAGTTFYDVSGNNNYFQLTNSPSYVSAEPKNFSLASASSQHFLYYASIGSPTGSTGISLPSANSWTCAFWFKTSTNTTYNPFLSHMGSGPVYCLMGTTGTTLTYYHYNGGWIFKNATTNVLDNVWHQAVFVNTANTMIIYLDGIVEKSSFSSTIDNASNLVNGFGGSWAGTFSGNLSNFMYYNIALSAAQVLQNYNATKGRFGL